MRDKKYSIRLLKKLHSFAETIPERPAIVDYDGQRITTFSDYVITINSYAYYLKKQNFKVGDIVAIEMDRCMEHFAMRFACAYLGIVFLSIDPMIPDSRKNNIYDDCKPKEIIDKKYVEKIPISNFPSQINEDLDDDSLYCIVYTSGTTGIPKGILHDRCPFEIVSSALEMIAKELDMSFDGDAYFNSTALSDVSFILSIADSIFGCCGACIHLISPLIVLNPKTLKEYFIKHRIDFTFILPTLLRVISPIDSLKIAFVSGEPCTYSFEDCKNTKVFNLYGSSEGTAIAYENTKYGNVICNTFSKGRLFIDEKNDNELCFTGPGVLIKYLHNKELSNKLISYNEKTGYRILRTRDKARYREDGKIQIIGRLDSVVKIRGKRVDKAEVEYSMSTIKEITQAAVKDFEADNNKYLCGYYTSYNNQPLDEEYIINELSKLIPHYMIPKYFVFKNNFKRNLRGKIDKNNLEKPTINNNTNEYVAPTNEYEKAVCNAFRRALGIKKIGINDDFVQLNGDSISLIHLLSYLNNYNIAPSHIIEYRTPKKIAKIMKKNKDDNQKEYSKQKYYELVGSQEFLLSKILEANKLYGNDFFQYNMVQVVCIKNIKASRIKDAIYKCFKLHPMLNGKIVKIKDKYMYERRDNYLPDINIVHLTQEPDNQFFESLVKPFNILEDNIFRSVLYVYKNDVYIFLDIYHLFNDGYSYQIIFKDILFSLLGISENKESINTYDLLLSTKDKYIKDSEINKKYFDSILKGREISKIPTSKKFDPKKLSLYDNFIFTVPKKAIIEFSSKNNTTPANLFLALLIYALANDKNLKHLLLLFFTHGRNVMHNDKNNVGCLYTEFPFSYDYKDGFDVVDIARTLNNQILQSLSHSFNYHDYPQYLSQHHIVFNFTATNNTNVLKRFIEEELQINFLNLRVPLYANIDFSYVVDDSYNDDEYAIVMNWNSAMYSEDDIRPLFDTISNKLGAIVELG